MQIFRVGGYFVGYLVFRKGIVPFFFSAHSVFDQVIAAGISGGLTVLLVEISIRLMKSREERERDREDKS